MRTKLTKSSAAPCLNRPVPASTVSRIIRKFASFTMAKAVPPLSYLSCSVSAAPIRREPSHRAEQTSQLLFGERVELLQINHDTDWARVRCAWDGYEGWCKAGQLQAMAPGDFRKAARTLSISQHAAIHMERGVLHLAPGSELTGIRKGHLAVGANQGKFKGKKLEIRKAERSAGALVDAAFGYLHAPYQWGGRTPAGIDCSGLVQLAFKLCGMAVLRDAADQASLGVEVHFLAESEPGDVAFFDNEDGRIVHVGILSGKHTIIHATDTAGRVVEDRIDNAGIISVSLKKRTHKLRTIRRLIP